MVCVFEGLMMNHQDARRRAPDKVSGTRCCLGWVALLDFHLETDVLSKALGDDLDVRTLRHFACLKI